MKLNEMPVMLKKREVMEGNKFYLYTYVNLSNGQEIRVAKAIPVIKEVTIEGDNNDVVLPVVPEKLVIKGNNNKVRVEDEDLFEIPWFLTPEYVQSHR